MCKKAIGIFSVFFIILCAGFAFAQGALDVYLAKNKNKEPLTVNNFGELASLLKQQGKDGHYALSLFRPLTSYEAVFALYPAKWKQSITQNGVIYASGDDEPMILIDVIDDGKEKFLEQMAGASALKSKRDIVIDAKSAEVYNYQIGKDGCTDCYIFSYGGHLFAVSSIYGEEQKAQSDLLITNIIKSFGIAKMDPQKTDGIVIENVDISPANLRGERTIKFETGKRIFYVVSPKEFTVRSENRHIYFEPSNMPKDSALVYLEKLGDIVSREDYERGMNRLISSTKDWANKSSVRLGRLNIKTSSSQGPQKNIQNFYFNNGGNFVLTVIAAPKEEQKIMPFVNKLLESVRLIDKS